MPHIYTYYDYEIRRECFKVVGDVGYTKTTDIVFNAVYKDTSYLEQFTQIFEINVVGDRGESNILITDNDVPVEFYKVTKNGDNYSVDTSTSYEMYDWSSEINENRYIALVLNYDIEHNLVASYKANGKCRGSKSRLTVFEETPSKFTTSIVKADNVYSYPESALSFDVNFVAGSDFAEAQTKTLSVSVDGVSVGEITVEIPAESNTGSGTVNLDGASLGSGLHNFSVSFEADEFNESGVLEFDISIGYNFTLIDHIDSVWRNGSTPLNVRVTDYFNNPLPNLELSLVDTNGNPLTRESSESVISYATLDSDGYASLKVNRYWLMNNYSNFTDESVYSRYYYRFMVNNTMSSNKGLNYFPKANIGVSVSELNYKGSTGYIDVTVTNVKEKAVVELTGDITETVTIPTNTELTGTTRIPYYGTGAGTVNFSANFKNSTTKGYYQLDDLLQYWKANSNKSVINYSSIGKVLELSGGWKLNPMTGENTHNGFVIRGDIDFSYELSFNVVNSGNSVNPRVWSFDEETDTINVTDLFGTDGKQFKYNDTITIRYNHSTKQATLFINNAQQATGTLTSPNPIFTIYNTSRQSLTIDNLKLKRL